MGSLFKPPKYTPPPAMERSNKLLDERDAKMTDAGALIVVPGGA